MAVQPIRTPNTRLELADRAVAAAATPVEMLSVALPPPAIVLVTK